MPGTPEVALAKEVREVAIDLLWRQWRAIGGSVTGSGQAATIVDPEALILMSLWLLDEERRLADVTASWVRLNSQLVSIQRVRNLAPTFPKVVVHRLSALAAIGLQDAKDARWKSLQIAAKTGLGERKSKERAIEVRLSSWATLMLQLRRGMGVGAKADVLTCMLGMNTVPTGWASVSTIAGAIGYSPASVRRAADDLSGARFIRSLDTVEGERSTQRMYGADASIWAQLLRISPSQPGWAFWLNRYRFIIDLADWLDRLTAKPVGEYARDVGARGLLNRHRDALLRDRILDSAEFAASDLNMEYLTAAWGQLATWIRNRA